MTIRLPRFHVARPRLTDVLAAEPLGVIVAGGGYGKSLLAAEFCDRCGVPALTAVLDGGGSADALLRGLRSSARQAGLSDAAAALAQSDGADGVLRALSGQPAVLVVDEMHEVEADAAELLRGVAAGLVPGQHLLLIGRHEPPSIAGWRAQRPATVLDTADLALTDAEIGRVCGAFGLSLDATEATAVREATDGWAAVVVLLAGRARAAGGASLAAGAHSAAATLAGLVDDVLAALPRREQAALINIAHLPLLDDDIVTAATGVDGLLTSARRCGLPLTAGVGGWVQMIGPVREELCRKAVVKPTVVTRAATAYARRGLPAVTAELLTRCGRTAEAAQFLAALPQSDVEALELSGLAPLIDGLPERTVVAHPRVLLQLARASEPAAATRRRTAALERGLELARANGDGALLRELQAEVARDFARDNGNVTGQRLARQVLAETEPSEELTRGRLLEALGQSAAWQRDDVHLAEAQDQMSTAAQIYRAHGQYSWLAQVTMALAVLVHTPRGEFADAVRCLDDALSQAAESRLRRGVILTFRAEILQEMGRYDEAYANVAEALAIADTADDPRIRAYAHWDLARAASMTGDADRVLAEIRAVEQDATDWFDQSGCMFLADAANYLDRVGLTELAEHYLHRAREHPEPDPPALLRSEAALLARSGDPLAAQRCIAELLAAPWFEPRDRWYATLLLACAAMRAGDPDAVDLTVDAFVQAARLGYPNLPILREPVLTDVLLGLAAGTPGMAALDIDAASLPVVVSMLGRFELTRGGRPLQLAGGQGEQLIKIVACAGGRIGADAATELLWPDSDPDIGANRLRTVLNRLRDAVGDVIVRDDRLLRLGPAVETDAARFEAQARQALALVSTAPARAVSVARGAIAGYRGDLLPDDPYESWTIAPRERLKRRAVALLDVCADRAAAGRDLDEAVRCLERAVDIVPDEEERYLLIARHLVTQGRRGAARAAVSRARAVLDDLGLLAPPALRELEEQVRRV